MRLLSSLKEPNSKKYMERADLYPYCLKKKEKSSLKGTNSNDGTVEAWESGHVSHKFLTQFHIAS